MIGHFSEKNLMYVQFSKRLDSELKMA